MRHLIFHKPLSFFFVLLARAGVWLLFIDLLALLFSLLTLSVSWRGPYTCDEKFMLSVTGDCRDRFHKWQRICDSFVFMLMRLTGLTLLQIFFCILLMAERKGF